MKLSDKKNIKAALGEAFEAPAPERKREFLRSVKKPGISNASFMLSQVSYIRKLTWILSAAIFAVLIFMSRYVSADLLWTLTACMPFVAMIAVSENMRSNIYNMAELEMTTRFSLKSVVFARMAIIGAFHFVLLVVLMIFAGHNASVSYAQMGVYLLVPYMMTAVISLGVARRLRGAEVNYVCMGIAVMVCVLNVAVQSMLPVICGGEYFVYWVLLLVLLIAVTAVECFKNIYKMEEALWN